MEDQTKVLLCPPARSLGNAMAIILLLLPMISILYVTGVCLFFETLPTDVLITNTDALRDHSCSMSASVRDADDLINIP